MPLWLEVSSKGLFKEVLETQVKKNGEQIIRAFRIWIVLE